MHKPLRTFLVPFMILAGYCIPIGPLPSPAELHAGNADSCCAECGTPCAACNLVECTVMVPMQVVVTRMQPQVVRETKERQETYTVFKRVHASRQFKREYCYLEDQVKTKTITEKKCHLVRNPAVCTTKVEVPQVQVREEVVAPCADPACGCGAACDIEPQVCTREVVVPVIEERSRPTEVPDVVFSTTKRQIDYCVKVPKKKVEVCAEERICKLVPVEKTRTVTVCVPKIVYQPVEVTVTKMMPQKILCCTSCCGHHRYHHHR